MWLSLLGTAFFMGLVGGPHCLAMCAAPCGAIVSKGEQKVEFHKQQNFEKQTKSSAMSHWLGFHLGRLMGYAAVGAVAAYAMEAVAWFSDRTAVLRPVWVLLHLAALAWGLLLLFQAKQPRWIELMGRGLWSQVRRQLDHPGRVLWVGCMWVFLPCGLLYSAIMVAALAGGVFQGALTMLAFGIGTGLWLVFGSWLWRRFSQLKSWRDTWGLRVAGGLLAAVSLWALWMNTVHAPEQWCR